MKKKETEVSEVESTETVDLAEKIKELEAKIAAGEAAALARVCKALKITPDSVEKAEQNKKTEPLIRLNVMTPVMINGRTYRGMVEVPHSTFEVIAQAIGDRRMRLIREMTGNNYQLQALEGGGYAPKVVGTVDASGERIA